MVEYIEARNSDMMQEAQKLELDVRNLENEKNEFEKAMDKIATVNDIKSYLDVQIVYVNSYFL